MRGARRPSSSGHNGGSLTCVDDSSKLGEARLAPTRRMSPEEDVGDRARVCPKRRRCGRRVEAAVSAAISTVYANSSRGVAGNEAVAAMLGIGQGIDTMAVTFFQTLGVTEGAGTYTLAALAHGAKSARVAAPAAMYRVTRNIDAIRLATVVQPQSGAVQRLFQITAAPRAELV